MTVDPRRALLSVPLAGEAEAQRRTWQTVRAAFEEREPVDSARDLSLRWLAPTALAAALLAAAITPTGRAVLGTVRDAIGRERVVERTPSRPALFALPAPGRVLVNTPAGPWIVHRDGSKRRLGSYGLASWSPQGKFLVTTRGHELLAVDPKGQVRWSLARRGVISDRRWAPGDGYRIAYIADENLRVVAGNGENDRLFRRGFPPAVFVRVAWQPRADHVLAAADRQGRIHLFAVDSNRRLWRTARGETPVAVAWSSDGARLAVLGRQTLRVFSGSGRLVSAVRFREGVDLAFEPGSHRLAVVRRLPARNVSQVLVVGGKRGRIERRPLFTGAGRVTGVAWSPNGRWLLVAWQSADQWLFVDGRRPRRIVAVSDITNQFGSGTSRPRDFPQLGGWCCEPSA